MADDEISLRHLKTLLLLLEVGSLTRAARILEVSQPTLSKLLARLRRHFGDPLLVRIGLAMEPTPKALTLIEPLKALLATSETLRASTRAFDPERSARAFTVIVTEVGMIQLVPILMQHLERAGPNLKLRALPLDSRAFENRLEGGEADLAIGTFPDAVETLRRQSLYVDSYVSVGRAGHPRLAGLRELEGFCRARHVLVTASNTGAAAHRRLEQILCERLPADRVLLSLPSFLIGAFVASRTDAVVTIPARLARFLAEPLGLVAFPTPLDLPPIEVDQFWSPRVHEDDGHRWLRGVVFGAFGGHSG